MEEDGEGKQVASHSSEESALRVLSGIHEEVETKDNTLQDQQLNITAILNVKQDSAGHIYREITTPASSQNETRKVSQFTYNDGNGDKDDESGKLADPLMPYSVCDDISGWLSRFSYILEIPVRRSY